MTKEELKAEIHRLIGEVQDEAFLRALYKFALSKCPDLVSDDLLAEDWNSEDDERYEKYFAFSARDEADKLWEKEHRSEETMEQWKNEHLRKGDNYES